MSPGPADEVLVQRLRRGDLCAFDAIHHRYARRLEGYGRQILGSQDGLAEDLVQEVFACAHRALVIDRQDVHTLQAWLYVLMRNRCLNELQARRCRGAVSPAEVADRSSRADNDPSALTIDRESLQKLTQGILALPTRQRTALIQRVLQGECHESVAAGLDVSVGASKSLVNRARKNLRAHIQEAHA